MAFRPVRSDQPRIAFTPRCVGNAAPFSVGRWKYSDVKPLERMRGVLRYLTNKKKQARREKNHDAVKDIYRRGASTIPADYLITHQEVDQATKDKLIKAAQERREQRNARRLANHKKQNEQVSELSTV